MAFGFILSDGKDSDFMKYVVVLCDGMSDYPLEELDNKTPMEYANKPYIDNLAKKGELFLVKTVPDGLKPGSDVANLAVMGYNPEAVYTGRSPLEAASIGVALGDDDTAFRANVVTLSGEGEYEDLTMEDYSSGEISTEESTELIKYVAEHLTTDITKYYPGVSYRHLMVWTGYDRKASFTPPHDILGQKIKGYLPSDGEILKIQKKSYELLKDHPINLKRKAEGKNTADSLWIWGEGKSTSLPAFEKLHSMKGAVVSAVDLVKGIGNLANMNVIEVPGVTGNIETNFDGKAEAAINALKSGCDYVYIHLEAPDECGHQGQAKEKARSIEIIDEKIVKRVCEALGEAGEDYRVLILPDHPTPVSIRTHAADSVPCLIYDSRKEKNGAESFTEKNCGNKTFAPGYKLINYFFEREEFSE